MISAPLAGLAVTTSIVGFAAYAIARANVACVPTWSPRVATKSKSTSGADPHPPRLLLCRAAAMPAQTVP